MSRLLCLQLENEALLRRNATLQRLLQKKEQDSHSGNDDLMKRGNRIYELETRLAKAEATIVMLEQALRESEEKLSRFHVQDHQTASTPPIVL